MSVPLPLDQQLCFSLYSASMAITRLYKPMLDTLGITYPQSLVLHALWEQDGRTVGAIAGRLDLDSTTVTPLVKRLEAGGWVTRARSAEDERRVHVSLTPKGRAIREECGCLGEALLARVGMPITELTGLNAAVKRLREALATAA